MDTEAALAEMASAVPEAPAPVPEGRAMPVGWAQCPPWMDWVLPHRFGVRPVVWICRTCVPPGA